MDLKPEDVNRFIAEGILKSAIGQKMQEAIDRVLDEWSKKDGTFADPFARVIEGEIRSVIHTLLLNNEFKPRIHKLVSEKLTDDVLQRFIDAAWEALQRQF